jgi:hypothetical protein
MMWFVCEILILIMKILDKIFQEFNFWHGLVMKDPRLLNRGVKNFKSR